METFGGRTKDHLVDAILEQSRDPCLTKLTWPVANGRIKRCSNNADIKWNVPMTQTLDVWQVGEGRDA